MNKLTIACVNIWEGGILWENLISFLQQTNADILLLQEVRHATDASLEQRFRSLSILPDALHYPFVAFAPTFMNALPVGDVEDGSAIFSRFPIISHEYNYYSGQYKRRTEQTKAEFKNTPRNLQHAVIDIDGTQLNVFNNHGLWDYHGNDTPERLAMGRFIADAVKGKSHVILGGDFNLDPTTKTVALIEEHLINVFGHDVPSTFNMRRKTDPGYAKAAVDMLFVSKDISVLKKQIPDVDVSDHFPLVITIQPTEAA